MTFMTAEEVRGDERLRQAPRRRCAGCGTRLNRYAAPERVLCTLCLRHDTEARLLCARRRMAGYSAVSGPEHLAGIEADALHEALWRMAGAELAADLRVVPAGVGAYSAPPTGAPRLLVADRRRIRGIWYADAEQRRDPAPCLALREEGYLVHEGYAAWSDIATLWSLWSLYPRSYIPISDPA